MTSLLDSLERRVKLGCPHTIAELANESKEVATRLLAAEPQLQKEFSGPECLTAYLRSLARGQESDARRFLQDPKTAPRLSMAPTPAAELHHQCATEPRVTPAPTPTPAASPPAPASVRVAPVPSARLALAPAKVRLGDGRGNASPFDRSIVAQYPEHYCL